MTKTDALKLVAVLQAAYPRQELREDTVEVYAMFLQDLDYRVAEKVIRNHILNERWFPTIAEIREGCVQMLHKIPTTEEAMEIVRQAVRRNDPSLYKQNELIKQAVNVVGFDKIGYSEYPEPLYNQIKEAYENLRKREIKVLQSSPAVGAMMLEQGGGQGDRSSKAAN